MEWLARSVFSCFVQEGCFLLQQGCCFLILTLLLPRELNSPGQQWREACQFRVGLTYLNTVPVLLAGFFSRRRILLRDRVELFENGRGCPLGPLVHGLLQAVHLVSLGVPVHVLRSQTFKLLSNASWDGHESCVIGVPEAKTSVLDSIQFPVFTLHTKHFCVEGCRVVRRVSVAGRCGNESNDRELVSPEVLDIHVVECREDGHFRGSLASQLSVQALCDLVRRSRLAGVRHQDLLGGIFLRSLELSLPPFPHLPKKRQTSALWRCS
mmetsp:Transcript_12131/g.22784  ORF Transcript_12131/g.22784 Transcript_12131/m.22784 type:complete len:267 (-) Transcript_12131:410-1210(-)